MLLFKTIPKTIAKTLEPIKGSKPPKKIETAAMPRITEFLVNIFSRTPLLSYASHYNKFCPKNLNEPKKSANKNQLISDSFSQKRLVIPA